MMTLRIRLAARAAASAALVAATLPSIPATVAAPARCGTTTLEGTVVADDDGTLRCGPGSPVIVRNDVVPPNPLRDRLRSPLAAFLTLPDMHVVDEESPLRTEWADRCDGVARPGAFRPHETLTPALLNAQVRAASALASNPTGSPQLHGSYSFAVQLGDATDNKHRNELRMAIDLLDGGKVVDPDSGADGYEGVQASDPSGGDPALRSPVAGKSIRDLGNEPFYAAGLRAGGGPLPWFSVLGNHDVKVQGSIPDDSETWRSFADAWAKGSVKITDLPQSERERACADPSAAADPSFWTGIASTPGSSKVVTADEQRDLLSRDEWIAEHSRTAGLPEKHGFERERCRDEDGTVLERGCYAWTQEPFRFIVLDTAAAEGEEDGNVDAAQFGWLRRELTANSSKYFSGQGEGASQINTENKDRAIVVFSHHGTDALGNAPQGADVRNGDDLKSLLIRFPNVILHMTGHRHGNNIAAHKEETRLSGYYEVSTGGPADWPATSRSIEISDNHDGTLSIFGVLFDAAAPADPRSVQWAADETDERRLGGRASVNEDWLASAAREIAFHDPQIDHGAVTGSKSERNVELLVRSPLPLTPPPFQPPNFPGFDPSRFGNPPNFGSFPTFPGFRPPPGFPPPGFPFPSGGPPQIAQPPAFATTGRGLGAPHESGPGRYPPAARSFVVVAMLGTAWLARARVRRHMIGI